DKVDGRLAYGADRAPDDACWLRVVRSPHPSAGFDYGDLDGFVAAHPGLPGVLTLTDFPNNRFPILPDLRDQARNAQSPSGLLGVLTATDIPNNRFAIFPDLRDQPAIAEHRVRMRGEAVLVLVGERDTIEAIDPASAPVRWQPQPALEQPAEALAPGAPAVHDRWPDDVLCRGRVARGRAE